MKHFLCYLSAALHSVKIKMTSPCVSARNVPIAVATEKSADVKSERRIVLMEELDYIEDHERPQFFQIKYLATLLDHESLKPESNEIRGNVVPSQTASATNSHVFDQISSPVVTDPTATLSNTGQILITMSF
ncbi:hypothetical protein Syun_011929 [Stephania yunnanensis]|uniref:Uncharacterized protein n=1 Tax=Stephania yunnanensis TaxID=152371 RepID=A0AAP0JZ83_9MAGN